MLNDTTIPGTNAAAAAQRARDAAWEARKAVEIKAIKESLAAKRAAFFAA